MGYWPGCVLCVCSPYNISSPLNMVWKMGGPCLTFTPRASINSGFPCKEGWIRAVIFPCASRGKPTDATRSKKRTLTGIWLVENDRSVLETGLDLDEDDEDEDDDGDDEDDDWSISAWLCISMYARPDFKISLVRWYKAEFAVECAMGPTSTRRNERDSQGEGGMVKVRGYKIMVVKDRRSRGWR